MFEEYIPDLSIPTRCKHGDKPCKKCGTSKKDTIHTTKNGKGKIASIFRKDKK